MRGSSWDRMIGRLTDLVYGPVPKYGDAWPGTERILNDRLDRALHEADVAFAVVFGGSLIFGTFAVSVIAGFVLLARGM